MTRVRDLVREVVSAATLGDTRRPAGTLKPSPADYAPPIRIAQYQGLSEACERGDCQYNVVPGAKLRSRVHGRCDGWRGTVYHEDVGPVLRVRPCDRRLAYERDRPKPETKAGKGLADSWK